MDCPNCGKDLQPFPFDMILPDSVLQTLVDKLFPEAVEADYQEEMQFYLKRRLPLPERLASRGNRLNRSIEDLDTSFTAMSEADSEMMSESHSLDVSLIAPELMTHSEVSHKTEAPTEQGHNSDPSNSENVPSDLDLLDKQIDALISVPAAEQAAPEMKIEISEPTAAHVEPKVEIASETESKQLLEHQSEQSAPIESAVALSEAMDVTPQNEAPSDPSPAPAPASEAFTLMDVAPAEDTKPAESITQTEAIEAIETSVTKDEAPAPPSESSMDVDPSTS